MIPLLLLGVAYLLGAVPFGYLLVRLRTGRDVRGLGSGNIGATNVLRTTGRRLGFLTLLLDVAKGWAAVWLMDRATAGDPWWTSLAAAAVVLGHAFPVFLRFQGGKAVASFVGAFLYLAPGPLLAVMVVFVVMVAVSGYLSLGSIVGAATFPLALFLIQHPPLPLLLVAGALCAFIVRRHRSNMERLRAGKENVFTLRGRKRQ